MNQNLSDFKQYGDGAILSSKDADPVLSCIASTKFNVDPTNPLRFQIGLCDTWMAQRCGRGWDKYCDIYLSDRKNDDFTGKSSKKWLLKALEEKFCRVDSSSPGSYCYEKCDLVDPLAPSGAQVCRTYGDVVYRDSNKLYNIDTNYNWSNTLTAPSPIKFKECKKVCDVFTLADFKEDDRILNECLDRGIGMDIIQDLAQNIVANKVPVQNSRLRSFIDRYIIGSGKEELTPGFGSIGQGPIITNMPIATPAVNPYLPPGSIYTVPDVGINGSEPSKNISRTEYFNNPKNMKNQIGSLNILSVMKEETMVDIFKSEKTICCVIIIILLILLVISFNSCEHGNNKRNK